MKTKRSYKKRSSKNKYSAKERKAYWLGYGVGYGHISEGGFPPTARKNTRKEDESFFSGHKQGSADAFEFKHRNK